MHGDTELLIDLIHKASKFLYRDYSELENLQQSGRKNTDFCLRAKNRVSELLSTNLVKFYKNIFSHDQELRLPREEEKIAIFDSLDGLKNMEKALPFFGIILSILNMKDGKIFAEKTIINFPIHGEIYYAEKGKGSWMVKYASSNTGSRRVRVSGNSDLAEALVMVDNHKTVNVEQIRDLRISGSYAYNIAALISGKADVCVSEIKPSLSAGLELLVQEAGGICVFKNNIFTASNLLLKEKIEHIIQKNNPAF